MKMYTLITLVLLYIHIVISVFLVLLNPSKSTHPLVVGLTLFTTSVLTMMPLSINIDDQMISMIVFLILIGGLMIIFLYFTSFINNIAMSTSFNNLLFSNTKSFFLMCFIVGAYPLLELNFLWPTSTVEVVPLMQLIMDNLVYMPTKITLMFSIKKFYTLLFVMIFLLLCLTTVVKLCMKNQKTLRKMK